jgi:hypothetical protein
MNSLREERVLIFLTKLREKGKSLFVFFSITPLKAKVGKVKTPFSKNGEKSLS